MGKIFCLMGKSSSGKDTIYRHLTEDKELQLERIVPYTTRPVRQGEKDGVEYHFVTDKELLHCQEQGRVVELRVYHTVHGTWKYFTVFDEWMNLEKNSYLTIGTLQSWHDMCKYFGREKMSSIYIEVEDGIRLRRALDREEKQAVPDYSEMCRRYLADTADFTEEKLKKEGITTYFQNRDLENCLSEIKLFIQKEMRYN